MLEEAAVFVKGRCADLYLADIKPGLRWLTTKNIAALEPPPEGHPPVYYRDTLLENFQLALPPSGKGTWCVDLNVQGAAAIKQAISAVTLSRLA